MNWLDVRCRDTVAKDPKFQTAIVRTGDRAYISNIGYVKCGTCEEKKVARKDPRTKPELDLVTSKEVGG